MMPETVSCVPLTSTVEVAPSVTAPAKLLVPVLALSAPPLSVSGRALTVTPRKSSMPALATVMPDVLPNPSLLLTASVPLVTVTGP